MTMLTTTNDHGIECEVRSVERLPNGLWRIDYASGLVAARSTEPRVTEHASELRVPVDHALRHRPTRCY